MIRHRGKRMENIQSKASQAPSYNWPMSEKEWEIKTRREQCVNLRFNTYSRHVRMNIMIDCDV
jgi:hypothetical protein